MTAYTAIFEDLSAPFLESEVGILQKGGKAFYFVRRDAIIARLNEVLGPENWSLQVERFADDSVVGKLSYTLPDGKTFVKFDLGGAAGMPDAGDDDKSMWTDALKRTTSQLGVGLYLHGQVPKYRERPPAPVRSNSQSSAAAPRAPVASLPSPPARPDDPTDGRKLFALLKKHGDTLQLKLIQHVQDWGRSRGFPERVVRYSSNQVAQALAEARRFAQKSRGDAWEPAQ